MVEKHKHAGSPELDGTESISGRAPCKWPLLSALLTLAAGVVLAVYMQMRPGDWVSSSGPFAVDAAQAISDVAHIVDDGTPRVVDTPAAAAGRERIKKLFPPELVFEESTMQFDGRLHGKIKLVNLMARMEGTDPTAGVIAVVAHSDSVRGAPGAGDDASGVVAVAHVARALVKDPPKHDVLFLITDGEEAGLLGARVFAEQSSEMERLEGVLNFDARGASGPAYVFELGPNTQELIPLMRRYVTAPRTTSFAAWIYEQMPNRTDFTVFRYAGLTGYNVAFIGDHPAYHTPQDTVERLNPSTMVHFCSTGLGLIRALDDMGPWTKTPRKPLGGPALPEDVVLPTASTAPLPERAAWTDILGLWIISWPERWSGLLACVFGAAVIIPAFWRAIGARVAMRAIAFVVGAIMVISLLAGVLGYAAGWGAGRMGVHTNTAPLRSLALHVLIWMAALVLVWAAGAWRRRGRPRSSLAAFVGVWTVWTVVACAGGLLLPAASPLLVLPVAGAAVGFLLGGLRDARSAVIWGSLAGQAAAVIAWLPLEPAFYDALGLVIGPVTGVRAVLVLAPLLPLVVLAVGEATTPQSDRTHQSRLPLPSSHIPTGPPLA